MKEFIIRESNDWREVAKTVTPVIGKTPFRVVLYRGLKRTGKQNKLLHAVFEECAKKASAFRAEGSYCDAIWWKNELKSKLGIKQVHFDIDDQPTVIIKSTTDYSTKEMGDFCEKIVAYMTTEYGVDIELPDELKKRAK